LITAVYAGIVAWRSSLEAQRQAAHSTARYLATQSASLSAREPELGMLAAVNADVLEDSVGARQALLAALQRSPMLTGSARLDDGARFSDVAVSPSGRTVVTVDGKRVHVWSVRDGRPMLRSRTELEARPVDVTLPSDDEVVLALDSGDVLTWRTAGDVRDGWNPAGEPAAIFVDRTRDLVITADDRSAVTVWDRATRHAMAVTESLTARPDVVAVSADRTRLAVSADRKVSVFDLSNGRRIRGPVDLGPGYKSVAFSPDLEQVVADARHTDNVLSTNHSMLFGGSPDPEGVELVNLTTGARTTGSKPGGTTSALVFLPDGFHVFTGEDTGQSRVLSIGRPPYVDTEPGHVGAVMAVAVSADGVVGASVDTGGRLLVRDLTMRADLGTGARAPGPALLSQNARVSEIAFDADDKQLLAAADNGLVGLIDLSVGKQNNFNKIGPWSTTSKPNVVGARFAADGRIFLTDKAGNLWEIAHDAQLDPPQRIGNAGPGALLAPAPDGDIVTGSQDGSVHLWHATDGTWTNTTLAGPDPKRVVSLDIAPDGRLLAIGRENSAVEVWNLRRPPPPAGRAGPDEADRGHRPEPHSPVRRRQPHPRGRPSRRHRAAVGHHHQYPTRRPDSHR
jgi:WD40 repeat protein